MLLTSFQNKAVTNKALIFNALFLIFMLAVGKADPMAVVFAYVFETVIIGILHLVKLGVIIRHNKPEQGSSTLFDYFVIPFFSNTLWRICSHSKHYYLHCFRNKGRAFFNLFKPK